MIKIEQECDGCGAKRGLNNMGEVELGGWRNPKDQYQLCPTCIKRAVSGAFKPQASDKPQAGE
jgi:hypothetical protein